MAAPRPIAAFLRVGSALADTVLLAQGLALCGLILWLVAPSEQTGLAVVGGSIASFISVFAFSLFGTLSFVWQAHGFWRTLHPLNLSLAMFAAVAYSAAVYGNWPALSAGAAVGGMAAALAVRFLPANPRVWIAICMFVLLGRYILPWRHAGIAAAAIGVFIFTAWMRRNFYNQETEPHSGAHGV